MILLFFLFSLAPGLVLNINIKQTIEKDDKYLDSRDFYIPEKNPCFDENCLKNGDL